MNILIGSNVHWWNAEAAYAASIAQLLQKAGHRIFVLTRPNSLNAEHLNKLGLPLVTHINLNTNNPFRLFLAYRQLRQFLKKEQIDLVNAHRSEGFPLYVLAARALKSFRLVRTRGTTRAVFPHLLNRKLHRDWTDAHIFAGKIVAERLLNTVSIAPEKLKVIYYPVECPELPFFPQKDYRKEFGISPTAKVLAVVGRIRPVKGQRLLLRSLSQLLVEFPDLILLMPYRDTPESEPEMQALRNDIIKLDLEKQIRLIPERKDILQIMEFADIGIVSSVESEVICRVAVEFFSVGTPVVALPTGCLPEIILNKQNGMLAQTQTPEALTEELRSLLTDSELCRRLGKNARHDAETRFAQQKMLTQTLNIYQQTLRFSTSPS